METLKIKIIDNWDYNENGAVKNDGEYRVDKIDLLIAGELHNQEDMRMLIDSLTIIKNRLKMKEKCKCCGK